MKPLLTRTGGGALPSLPEVHHSVRPVKGASGLRRALAFAGPGFLVAVGYMDPGNWATSIAGGSAYGYTLLSVIFLSNFMAMVLQSLCVRLGIGARQDLAQACRNRYARTTRIALWLLAEIAIVATDLAEVIGTAIALKLLFGLPIIWGVALTALDVFAILYLQKKGFRYIEAVVITLVALIGLCFVFELIFSRPDLAGIGAGLLPDSRIVTDPGLLYLAIGVIGATVMPHNLYLHSSIVQTRYVADHDAARKRAIRYATWDSSIALMFALFINGAILVVAAATFHASGKNDVAGLEQAYRLLSPVLDVPLASALLGIALLLSGLNSTLTATLSGQIVMEGFVHLRMQPWARRLFTRLIAILPAAAVAGLSGASGIEDLLVLSQVVLSLQLPFAVVPLIRLTSDTRVMGRFASGLPMRIVAWSISALIIVLNVKLVTGWLGGL